MTSLGIIKKYDDGKYIIYLSVSGDLSYSYHLALASSEDKNSIGIGYYFKSFKDAKRFLNIAKKYGYGSPKFDKMYNKYSSNLTFGYLPFKEAKPFLKEAYGDVAERYKKRLMR